MANQEIRLTAEGYQKTLEELEYLKWDNRGQTSVEVILLIGSILGIAELDAILKRAVIIDPTEQSTEHVHLGSKVKVHDCEFDEDVVYQIIGSKEADPFNGKLSDESPVGAALIGRQVGEMVNVETPEGVNQFIILEITQ